jgi:hypothetical protein
MVTRLRCRICLGFGALTHSGCFAGVSRMRYSAPYIDDPKVAAEHVSGDSLHSMFSFNDIALFTYPANVKNVGDVLVFPAPWSMTVAEHPAPDFEIYIGIRPVRDGFVLDPAAINLNRSGAERMTPTRILGIFDCGIERSHLVWRLLPVDPIVLKQGIGTCFGIAFQIPAPDPSEKFSIQVNGLSLDGMPYALPEVRFKEARRLDPFGAP